MEAGKESIVGNLVQQVSSVIRLFHSVISHLPPRWRGWGLEPRCNWTMCSVINVEEPSGPLFNARSAHYRLSIYLPIDISSIPFRSYIFLMSCSMWSVTARMLNADLSYLFDIIYWSFCALLRPGVPHRRLQVSRRLAGLHHGRHGVNILIIAHWTKQKQNINLFSVCWHN